MCAILSRRCLWQLSALFEQQSQSAVTAANRVAVTAAVGDTPLVPALHLLLLLPLAARLHLLSASPLPVASPKVADIASVPPQLRLGLD